MSLSPTLFSVACASMAPYQPWDYRWLVDPAASSAIRAIGLKSVRMNAMTALGDIFGGNLTNAPNWSHFDNIVKGFNNTFGSVKFIMVLFNHGMYNVADPNVRTRIANCYVQCAAYLKSKGVKVDYWEVINEPNADTPSGVMAETEKAVRNALRAAGDQTPVGGPTATWAQPEYMNASANAGANFSDWHAYAKNPGEGVSTDTLFDRALNQIGAGGSGPKPWFLTEYNIDTWHDPGQAPDPRQQQIEGSIFAALVCIACANRDMAAVYLWVLENNDGSYGPFHTNTWNLNPVGCMIQAANKYMIPGSIVSFSTGTPARTIALLSDGGDKGRSLMLVNYNTSGAPVQINVPTGMSLRWVQSPASPHGAQGNGTPSSVTVPPMGIAILSTSAAPSKPDDADGTKVGAGVPLQANGYTWLIKPDKKVYVDDQVDNTTANVVSLQFVKPLVVQTNEAGGQWSKQQPSDPWQTYTGPTPVPPQPPTDDVAAKAKKWDDLVVALKPLYDDIANLT